jgi:predicted dehydrogenase
MEVEREATIAPPDLSYLPPSPRSYRPKIGLIGCGGITEHHLKAYRSAGFDVAMLCDLDRNRAEEKRELFYPDAAVRTDFHDLLRDDAIEVVDLATHPDVRPALVEAALLAGKHVLSQKPFVLDLDEGKRLVDLAGERGLKLAVNQNGRFAPHFRYMHLAAQTGLLGELCAVDVSVYWDHGWTASTPFDAVQHLILYDFAIHWFDFVQGLFGPSRAERVFATSARSPIQKGKQPMLAQAAIEYATGQATLVFAGDRLHGRLDRTSVLGTKATIHSQGPDLQKQQVSYHTEKGRALPRLEGAWFPDGFQGTMGELLCAIEEGREPCVSAAANLASLELCFAACRSSLDGAAKVPGEVRSLE